MKGRSTLRKFSGFYQNNLFRIKYKFMKQKVLKIKKKFRKHMIVFKTDILLPISYFIYRNKTKSIGVSEANSSCIWFVNGGIINSYQ